MFPPSHFLEILSMHNNDGVRRVPPGPSKLVADAREPRNGAPLSFAFTARFLTWNNERRPGRTTKTKRVTRLQRQENIGLHRLARPQRTTNLRKSTSYSDVLHVLWARRSRDSARWRRKRSAHFKLVEGCPHAEDGDRCKLIPGHCNGCNFRKRAFVRWR